MANARVRVRDGALADHMLTDSAYDLAVLDLMLPEMDGVTVLKRLRVRRNQTPVLVLTARSAIGDRVDVLDVGADDYLVKPVTGPVLQARINAVLRRAYPAVSPTGQETYADFVFDIAAAVSQISVQGHRYPDAAQKWIDR